MFGMSASDFLLKTTIPQLEFGGGPDCEEEEEEEEEERKMYHTLTYSLHCATNVRAKGWKGRVGGLHRRRPSSCSKTGSSDAISCIHL